MQIPDWIAVDWGTSSLRCWAVINDDEILDYRSCDHGMANLNSDEFELVFLRLIDGWLPTEKAVEVIACGMVGAKQGWIEAPYQELPCSPITAERAVIAPTKNSHLTVRILPGICQRNPDDVIRGEETQVAGFLARQDNFQGIIMLPGTHCKWVMIKNQQIVGFRSYMTGELYSVISQKSVLRHSISNEEWDDKSFYDAIEEAMANSTALTASLFSVRAASLLSKLPGSHARARLSGLLIGSELADLDKIQDSELIIIGAAKPSKAYKAALNYLGRPFTFLDGKAAAFMGLVAARRLFDGNIGR